MKKILPSALIAIVTLCVAWAGPVQSAKAGDLITDELSYTLRRSDSSPVSTDKNEFHHGSHQFFSEFTDNKVKVWIDTKMDTFKSGWSRLYLDWPTRLSSITLQKASADKADFKGGYIKLEVQSPKGQWTTVFERQDDDVDKAITLKKEISEAGLIKGVRISFKTPGPITIGPIDLRK